MNTNIQQPIWTSDLISPRWLWLILVALPILALIAFVGYRSTQVLPRLALAPSYSLLDQDGNRLTNEDLRGKLVLYSFTPTRCESPCVDTSRALQTLQQKLATSAKGDVAVSDIPVHFVLLSTDTKHDPPAHLRAYADTLGMQSNQWHFVSGDTAQFVNFLQAEAQSTLTENRDFASEPLIVLVDGWGILRAMYRAATPDLDRIERDLRLIALEAKNSTGVSRYAYETVHLFMCHNGLGGEPSP